MSQCKMGTFPDRNHTHVSLKTAQNRHTYKTRKRRIQHKASMKLVIPKKLFETRTLKKSARNAIKRQEASYKWIWPWTHDPTWKLDGRTIYPEAHLLNLPPELRQDILRMSLIMPGGLVRGARGMLLSERIGELSCVCPQFRFDMVYVGDKWKEEYLGDAYHEMRQDMKVPRWASVTANGWWMKFIPKRGTVEPGEMKKGCAASTEAKVEQQSREGEVKSRQRKIDRNRQQKCWYCEMRHKEWDAVCPMERVDRNMWEKVTKVKKDKHVEAEHQPFKRKKNVFKERGKGRGQTKRYDENFGYPIW